MTLDKARTGSEQIDRTRQKETGEVFTPPAIIERMIAKCSNSINRLDKTFLEPAAGDGNIVLAVLEHKLNVNGYSVSNALQAISGIYACEYMKDNHEAMVQRIKTFLINSECWSDEMDQVLAVNIAYCNTLDPKDTSDGRKFPEWLLDQPVEPLSWMYEYGHEAP